MSCDEIATRKPKKDEVGKKKIGVIQEFNGPNGISLVSYTMRMRRAGEWKLTNVIIDGVSLGVY